MPPDGPITLAAPAPPATVREARGATDQLDLSVIIVNWNTRHLVRGCLESVLENLGALAAEVLVVDNASADGSARMIARDFPGVQLIANTTNRGFAAANNQGMRVARGRYLLLLNPDTVVLDDALQKTLAFARCHPQAAVVGCRVMRSAETAQRTCFRFPSPMNALLWVTGAVACFPRSRIACRATYGRWGRDDEREVDVVSGMFMLVRREALEEVGLMDEQYFMYAEEADWCYRFRKAGWRCLFTPVGRILHLDGGGKSTEQVSVRMYVELQKGLLRFHHKHLGFIAWSMTKLLFTVTMTTRTVWWGLSGALGIGARSAIKARQAAAAARYHWTSVEPESRDEEAL